LTQRKHPDQPGYLLIFDLDGTISDPALGIGRCLNYSLNASGYSGLADEEVSRFIGPPLDIAFRQITGSTSEKLISVMVSRFRERYGQSGYAENRLYPGISEGIRYLASRQIPMGICTSKRVDFAEKVLVFFQLREYFSFIRGGDVGITKEDQLRSLLESSIIRRTAMMIGDRATDIHAAHAHGLVAVGVLWGHGSERELQEASPEKLLKRPEQLKDLIRADHG
jgi:phosphoglycolate phosphatase